ncbi:MAG TPA: class I adenylate-forming enzyme family protein [Acidimicrobiia bacterium]
MQLREPDPVIAQLTGPDGPFEIVVEDVLGKPTQVYRRRMRALGDVLEQSAGRDDLTWLVQGDRRLTFAEHNAAARRCARSLRALGIARRDRVAIVSANCPEWVVMFWACALIGAIAVPLNAWWKTEELEFGLTDSGARVLVTDAKRLELVRPILGALPELEQVFVIGADGDQGGVEPFAKLLGDSAHAAVGAEVDEDDIFAILYTSGTTGRPKGATITHRQIIANLQNIIVLGVAQAMRGTPPPEAKADVQSASLLVVPLFHVTGCLSTMTVNYATGAKLVLMPPGRFDPVEAMRVIERERVTSIGGVPTIMWRIIDAPERADFDLSSVQRASYGGAPAAPELVDRIAEAFPNLRKTLTTAYGLTETASVATAHGGDDYFAHPGSVGRPAPTVELKIVGDDDREQPTGSPGEIWIKGPNVMAHGYWNRPDANALSFTDGWFHTGDIGKVDADGFVYIVDRAKDLIIRAGENIACVEIEHVLFQHPDVVDAAVVGVTHPVLGEEVKAVVQVKTGAAVTADDLRAFCRIHLADFKVPEHVEMRSDALPRNPAGKVLKNLLRGGESAFAVADDSAL